MAEPIAGPAPACSVVVPTLNTRGLTLACLRSLHAAEVPEGAPGGVEILLVDDGGTDGTTEAVAERFPDVRLLRNDRPTGFTRAANRGLAAARGELLLLLNSDTEVSPDLWHVLSRAFDQRGELGVAGAALRYPDGSEQWSGGREPTPMWLVAVASGLGALRGRVPGVRRRGVSGAAGGDVDWVSGAAMAFRRRVWDEAGPLDERFHLYGQDLDFCCLARRDGWAVTVLEDFRVVHHLGATVRSGSGHGSHHDPASMWPELVRWADKWGGPERARRFASALAFGGHLRLAGRHLRRIVLRRPATAEDASYEAALEALKVEEAAFGHGTEPTSEPDPPNPHSNSRSAHRPNPHPLPPGGR